MPFLEANLEGLKTFLGIYLALALILLLVIFILLLVSGDLKMFIREKTYDETDEDEEEEE